MATIIFHKTLSLAVAVITGGTFCQYSGSAGYSSTVCFSSVLKVQVLLHIRKALFL